MRRVSLALLAATLAGGARAQDFPGFERRAVAGSHAVMEVGQPHPVRLPGLATIRFELRPGECGAPCPPDTERAQMMEAGGQPLGTLAYTVFSVFIPRAVMATPGLPVTLAAFLQDAEPRLAIQWTGEGLIAAGPGTEAPQVIVPANLVASRWHDFLVEHRWSAGAEGHLRLWVNGLARPSFSGPTMMAGPPPRFAFGLSRAPVSAWTTRYRSLPPPQVAYFAHVRRDPDRGKVDIDLMVR